MNLIMDTNLNQIGRIQRMEQLFNMVLAALKEPSISPTRYKEVQDAVAVLSDYYSSNEWKLDFADDEAGLLPEDLKRGVLSEDGLWNLLVEWKEFIYQCHKL